MRQQLKGVTVESKAIWEISDKALVLTKLVSIKINPMSSTMVSASHPCRQGNKCTYLQVNSSVRNPSEYTQHKLEIQGSVTSGPTGIVLLAV
jgi:hypothetical protein